MLPRLQVSDTLLFYSLSWFIYSKVHALSHPHGDLLWSSPPLEGACEGTPYYTSDGAYVFVTHNSVGGTVGHFSVLDTAAASVYYSYSQPNPFGPFAFNRDNFPGGNYGAGAGNMNDLAVWGYKPTPGATSGEQGSSFAFQMPPATSIVGPTVTTLLNVTSWRHTAAPLLAARGQELYWFVSRSKVRAWTGTRFSAGADAEADFNRGSPPFKAAPYTPVVNDEANPTIMCGGPANEEFTCLSTTELGGVENNTMTTLWSISLGTGLIYGDPLMSTGGDRVYFADSSGIVSAADPATGALAWSAPTGVVIQANPELSSDGARFYFAEVGGAISCWEVAQNTLAPVALPPRNPTAAPTVMDSMAPSGLDVTPAPVASPVASGGDQGGSIAPSVAADTAMPFSMMPILTAAPVSRPLVTSGASSVSVYLAVAFGTVAMLI